MGRHVEWGGSRGRAPLPERLYDALALLLLMWPATAGVWLMGSTRTWGYAPGLFLSFSGSLLVLARPLLFRDTPRGHVPPGFWAGAVVVAYIVLRVSSASVPYAARWEALRWGCLLAAAWSWTQMGARSHRWKWLLGVLLMAAAIDGLYAIVQHMNGSEQVLWAPRPEQYGLRASGTYLCPNHFANLLALSQMTPGPISINTATYVGYTVLLPYGHAFAIAGSVVATIALCLPSVLMMWAVIRFLFRNEQNRYVQYVFSGLRPAVVGLIFSAGMLMMVDCD